MNTKRIPNVRDRVSICLRCLFSKIRASRGAHSACVALRSNTLPGVSCGSYRCAMLLSDVLVLGCTRTRFAPLILLARSIKRFPSLARGFSGMTSCHPLQGIFLCVPWIINGCFPDAMSRTLQVCCCPMFFFWDVFDDVSHPGGVPMKHFSSNWQVRLQQTATTWLRQTKTVHVLVARSDLPNTTPV